MKIDSYISLILQILLLIFFSISFDKCLSNLESMKESLISSETWSRATGTTKFCLKNIYLIMFFVIVVSYYKYREMMNKDFTQKMKSYHYLEIKLMTIFKMKSFRFWNINDIFGNNVFNYLAIQFYVFSLSESQTLSIRSLNTETCSREIDLTIFFK